MPRRLSRKADTQVEADPIDAIATPKKGRKTVKVEETDVVAKSPAKSAKNRVKTETAFGEENIEGSKDSGRIKINRVKRTVLEEEKTPESKKLLAKRKSKAVDDEAGEKKVTKKRKTREEKEAEAMPLAARTVVEGLKKTMYIGAHVSGAGGMLPACPT